MDILNCANNSLCGPPTNQWHPFLSVWNLLLTWPSSVNLVRYPYPDIAHIFRRPGQQSKITLFIDPFTPLVWMGIAGATLLAGPIFWFIHRSSVFYRAYSDGFGGLGELKNCFWYTYGALLQQGTKAASKALLFKIWTSCHFSIIFLQVDIWFLRPIVGEFFSLSGGFLSL